MCLKIISAILLFFGATVSKAATVIADGSFQVKYNNEIFFDYFFQDGYLVFNNPITLHAFWFTNYGSSYLALHSYTTTIKTADGKSVEYFRIVNSLEPYHRATCGFVYFADDPTEDSMCAGFRLKTAMKNVTSLKIDRHGSVNFNIFVGNRYLFENSSPDIFSDLFIYSNAGQVERYIPLINHANVPLPANLWLMIGGFASLIAFHLKSLTKAEKLQKFTSTNQKFMKSKIAGLMTFIKNIILVVCANYTNLSACPDKRVERHQ